MTTRAFSASKYASQSAPFAASVSFAANSFYTRKQVEGAIAFTVNAATPIPFAHVYTSLVADGVNAPSFTGFKEWGGSAGYDNTAGQINKIDFFFDGVDYHYSVFQNATAVTAPRATAVGVTNASNQVSIAFSKALNTTAPAASAFSVSNTGGAQTVSSVSISGSTVTLTMNRNSASGETVTIGYTPPATNALKSTDGEYAGAFAALSGTASSTNYIRLTTIGTALSETVNGSGGYNYSSTATSYTTDSTGVSTAKIPASADGYVGFKLGATIGPSGDILGVSTSAANHDYSGTLFAIYQDTGLSTTYYNVLTNGGGIAPASNTTVAPAAGDLVILRRTGTTVTAEVSKNGGTSYTVVNTWTGATTSALYLHVQTGHTETNAIIQPYGSANVA